MTVSDNRQDAIALEPGTGPIWASIRTVLRQVQKLRMAYRRAVGRHPRGVHAIAVTKRNRVVLIKLTYAVGWRLPGGGLKPGEEPAAGAVRELSEEIRMRRFAAIEPVVEFPQGRDPEQDVGCLYLFRDVECEPRRSIEIDAVREFALDDLPADLAPGTAKCLKAADCAIRLPRNGRFNRGSSAA